MRANNLCQSLFVKSTFLHLLVFTGRHAHDLTEKTGEVIIVLNPYLITNLINFHVRKIQQLASLLYF